ncbi:MAG: hypothetical protein HRK26_00350 [Rickettsiaceae bacterium H1]|nr:hypothetical protein [Rickettsiaceae bacterium H1]
MKRFTLVNSNEDIALVDNDKVTIDHARKKILLQFTLKRERRLFTTNNGIH